MTQHQTADNLFVVLETQYRLNVLASGAAGGEIAAVKAAKAQFRGHQLGISGSGGRIPSVRLVRNEHQKLGRMEKQRVKGKLMGLPLNRALFDDDGHIYDIVSGNFLIVGLGEENFTDLSPDLMEKYGEQFKYPEKFARLAGEIIAVKQPATNEHREKPMMHHSGPDL